MHAIQNTTRTKIILTTTFFPLLSMSDTNKICNKYTQLKSTHNTYITSFVMYQMF